MKILYVILGMMIVFMAGYGWQHPEEFMTVFNDFFGWENMQGVLIMMVGAIGFVETLEWAQKRFCKKH